MRIIGIVIIILTVGFLAGYGLLQSGTINLPSSSSVQNEINSIQSSASNITGGQQISEEDAKVIAIENSGVEPGAVYNLRAKQENYYGEDIYDVEFIADHKEYNYNISTENGNILSMDYELEDNSRRYLEGKPVSEQEAIDLMVSKVPNADRRSVQIKRDNDDNRMEYKGKFVHNGVKYEAVVDADTGVMVEWKEDSKH